VTGNVAGQQDRFALALNLLGRQTPDLGIADVPFVDASPESKSILQLLLVVLTRPVSSGDALPAELW